MEKNTMISGKNIRTDTLLNSVVYIFIIVLAVFILFPIVYIFLASFKTTQELMAGGIRILPSRFSFENYVTAWRAANFSRYTLNSIIYSGTVTLITIMFSTMLGYCLNRKEFPGKGFILKSYLFSMFIAGAVTIFPVFLLIVRMHLNKTLLGLIIATIGGSQTMGMFLVLGYLNGIPKEIDDSAFIDGCGIFRTYFWIIMPLIKPVIGVVAMITFQGTWNNYMLPLALTLTNPKIRPLSVGVTSLVFSGDSHSVAKWDLLVAGSCMAIIPIALVYLFTNRYFTSGIASGALKG